MIIDERVLCRSIVNVTVIIAGVSLNKRRAVMLKQLHGELLIEMEDNVYL